MNHGTFAGRIGRDAEVRHGTDGKPVANFALAVDTGWGDRKKTLWVDCAVWGERGEKLAPYLTKGKSVTVAGDIDLRTFQKNDGSAGASITCNAQRVTLQGGGESTSPPRAAAPPARPANPAPPQKGADFDDDIPF